MKKKKLLIIGLTILLIVSSLSLTASAVHSGGETLYVSPLRFDFEIDGVVADLTPSLTYTSGQPYTRTTYETRTTPNGEDVIIGRNAIEIGRVSQNNSAIECAYRLSMDTINSLDNFTMHVTSPNGLYNFQKYTVPQILVPIGYSAEAKVSYKVYRTDSTLRDSTLIREFNKTTYYTAYDSIDLLYPYYLLGGEEVMINGNCFILDYQTEITFTKGETDVDGTLPAGWYRWQNVLDEDFGLVEYPTGETLYEIDCSVNGNQVYMATVNSDYSLSYTPISKIGIAFIDYNDDDYLQAFLEYLNRGEYEWDIIYSFYQDTWYVPDEEEQLGDGITTGITPITIKYLEFRQPVRSCTRGAEWFYTWFARNTTYSITNPIVTGEDTLIHSVWYLKDVVEQGAMRRFYESFEEYIEPLDITAVDIPIRLEFATSINDPMHPELGIDSCDGVLLEVDYNENGNFILSANLYAYIGSPEGVTQYDQFPLGKILDGGQDPWWATSYVEVTDSLSPIAYEFLNTFAELVSLEDPNEPLPTTFAFTDGDTPLVVKYTLDNESVLQYQYGSAISSVYNLGHRLGMSNGSGEFSGDYGGWLSTAVGGFMSFEIFPNFSLGGVLGVAVAVTLLMMFLKFFAGG